MTSTWYMVLCQISVLAFALVAGVFLTFSDFVMRSLRRAKTSAGVEVMQGINRDVMASVFMALLLSMSALSPFLVGYAWMFLAGPASMAVIAGGVLYLAGVFVVTLVFNVPMNNRLAATEHTGPDAAAYWRDVYLPRWTFWNTARALSSVGSAVFLLVACVLLARAGVAIR